MKTTEGYAPLREFSWTPLAGSLCSKRGHTITQIPRKALNQLMDHQHSPRAHPAYPQQPLFSSSPYPGSHLRWKHPALPEATAAPRTPEGLCSTRGHTGTQNHQELLSLLKATTAAKTPVPNLGRNPLLDQKPPRYQKTSPQLGQRPCTQS